MLSNHQKLVINSKLFFNGKTLNSLFIYLTLDKLSFMYGLYMIGLGPLLWTFFYFIYIGSLNPIPNYPPLFPPMFPFKNNSPIN